MIEVSTDNRNRTAAELRHALTRSGGNLGTTGCVAYLFNKKGVIVIEKANVSISEEELMLIAIDNGAQDFEVESETYEIATAPEDFSKIREAFEGYNIEFLEAEIQMVPDTYVKLDEKEGERMEKLIDALEDLDDVMNVYHNWDE